MYINAVKLNGKTHTKNYITYNNIMQGGTLDIYMQDNPDKNWGSKPADQPSSLSMVK